MSIHNVQLDIKCPLISISDISRNRFTEIPLDICAYCSLEKLNCYHNVIRCLPEALVQLQALVHLNLRYSTTLGSYSSLHLIVLNMYAISLY